MIRHNIEYHLGNLSFLIKQIFMELFTKIKIILKTSAKSVLLTQEVASQSAKNL